MRNRVIRIVGGVGLLGAFAALYATPVSAQWTQAIRAIVVRNVDERGRDPYMEFQARACQAPGILTCEIEFPPVPAGKRLVLEHVNASINFATGGVRRTALLAANDAIFVLPVRPASDPDLVIVSESILAYYDSGQAPIFQIVVSDGTDIPVVTAAVSGYFVSLGP